MGDVWFLDLLRGFVVVGRRVQAFFFEGREESKVGSEEGEGRGETRSKIGKARERGQTGTPRASLFDAPVSTLELSKLRSFFLRKLGFVRSREGFLQKKNEVEKELNK